MCGPIPHAILMISFVHNISSLVGVKLPPSPKLRGVILTVPDLKTISSSSKMKTAWLPEPPNTQNAFWIFIDISGGMKLRIYHWFARIPVKLHSNDKEYIFRLRSFIIQFSNGIVRGGAYSRYIIQIVWIKTFFKIVYIWILYFYLSMVCMVRIACCLRYNFKMNLYIDELFSIGWTRNSSRFTIRKKSSGVWMVN